MFFNKYLIDNVDLLVLKLGIEDFFLRLKVSSDKKCYRSCSAEFKRYMAEGFSILVKFLKSSKGGLEGYGYLKCSKKYI